MNGWQVLGIEPTSDESLIRRAYARLLKIHRPDSDPQGYQQLREAFDWAKNHAGAAEAEAEPYAQPQPVAESQDSAIDWPEEIAEPQDESSHTVPQSYAFSVMPLYSEQEIAELAAALVEKSAQNFPALQRLHQRVSEEGNLLQQQQFHQDLAASLAEQPGLQDWLVEQVSERLGWQLESYNSGHLIPEALQRALDERVRATEAEKAWQKLMAEQRHAGGQSGLALKLLCSDRAAAPFWIRLVPGLLDKMSQQVNQLWSTFPELIDRLNPAMLDFLRERPRALNWQGVFLLVFWGVVLKWALPQGGLLSPIGLAISGVVIYSLWLYDLMLSSLRRSWLMKLLLVLDSLFCSLLLLALFVGVLMLASSVAPPKGESIGGLLPVFIIAIELLVLWSVWSKAVPGLRRPGVAVARLLSSPWRLLKVLDFETIGFVLVSVYSMFCTVLLNKLLNQLLAFIAWLP